MSLYDDIEAAIDALPSDVDREWIYSGEYPQRVSGQGNAVVVAEVYENPSANSSLARYIALVSPANVQKLLFELKVEGKSA